MKKISLLIAVLVSIGVTVGAHSANAASKDSPTVVTNETLTTDGTSRNFLPTGTEPLYSKVPVSKSAKVLTKADALKTLAATSDSGQTYFRGYRAAQTSQGKWYLKVVSFDKTHRGWVYVGTTDPTSDPTIAGGGLKFVHTFVEGTLDPVVQSTTFYFTTPKTPTLTYTAPDYTQYKVGRNMTSTLDYYKDPLKVTAVGSKQNGRGANAKYYYVTDTSHPQVNGWVAQTEVSTNPPK